jgi:hypothetical protein
MQLSVVRNLILMGCSDDIPVGGLLVIDAVGWRSMYLVVMPRVNFIVILATYARYLYSINCPTVICLPSVLLFILWRDTTSELRTPGPIFFTLLSPVYFTRTVYFLAYYYYFPLDTLISLFTANRWDWQHHRKLGTKYLVVLCAGSALLLVEDVLTSIVNGALVGESLSLQASPSGVCLFPTGLTNLGFLLREICCFTHHTFLLGFPTGRWFTSTPPQQAAPETEDSEDGDEAEDSLEGTSSTTSPPPALSEDLGLDKKRKRMKELLSSSTSALWPGRPLL